MPAENTTNGLPPQFHPAISAWFEKTFGSGLPNGYTGQYQRVAAAYRQVRSCGGQDTQGALVPAQPTRSRAAVERSAGAPCMCHKPRTSLKPSFTRRKIFPGRDFTRFVKSARSIVNICEMFTTDGFGKPESDLLMRTFPGA